MTHDGIDQELNGEIRRFVRSHQDAFREAGQKIDAEYSVERCLERDRAFLIAQKCFKVGQTRRVEEFTRDGQLATFKITTELPTPKDGKSKNHRIREAVDALLREWANPRALPAAEFAHRVVIVHWVITDPEAATLQPALTEFQDWSLRNLSHDLMHAASDGVVSDWPRWKALVRAAWQVVSAPYEGSTPPVVDQPSYHLASRIIERYHDIAPDMKTLHQVLRAHPKIRRWKPSPQRLKIHIGDWLAYAREEPGQKDDGAHVDPSPAEIEVAKAAVCATRKK